jgi:hypothetical protein
VCLLAIATPAAFRASPSATVAASVVGAMLTPWHYVAIAAPLLLLLLKGGGKPPHSMVILFAALLLATAQAMVDLRIRAIRRESPRPISSLALTDPVRRRFGLLHGASSLLLIGQAIAAAAVVGRNDS